MCKHSEIADLTGMWGLSEKWSSRARRVQPGQTVRVSGGWGGARVVTGQADPRLRPCTESRL